MNGTGKLKLGEACRVCGHFRGLHANVRGCIAEDGCKCQEGQISILEHALAETDTKLEALIVLVAAREGQISILERALLETYQALDEDLKERIREVRNSLLVSLGIDVTDA